MLSLKKKIANLKIKRLLKEELPRQNKPFVEAKQFGILFSVGKDEKLAEAAVALRADLAKQGMNVRLLAYRAEVNGLSEGSFDIFSQDDFDFFFTCKDTVVEDFMETAFDYLICLDEEMNVVIKYVLARSRAHCRIGNFREGMEPFFDFMLVKDVPWKQFSEELIRYVKKIYPTEYV